ncbi:hypothetical protein D3C72_2041350 [compost metagenome]
MQPRLDAGGEVVRHHLGAHQVEHAAARHAGRHGLKHAAGVHVLRSGKAHGLGDAFDIDHLGDLVAQLGDLAGAVVADMSDGLAQ